VNVGRVSFVAGASMWVAACGGLRVDTSPTANDEQVYSSFYPYYAEYCAASQLKKRPGFGTDPSSGVGGHSVFWLNGVCRDTGAGYPTIKLCDGTTPADQQGVGLSVNAHFKNTVWVATPGRDFFFHGTLAPSQRLTRAEYEHTLAVAQKLGIYDGVEYHADVFDDQPPGMSRSEFMYDIAIATDYAVNFGRDRYCARVPVDREQMTKVVGYLNDLNAEYKSGERDFEWNVLQNNCAHVTHNALATAGVWNEWATGEFVLFAAFNFPAPKNEFVNLIRRTNDMPVDDLMTVYEDSAAREALMQGDGLPAQPGSLAEAEKVVWDNEIYDTDLALIFYDDPVFGSYKKRFRDIFADRRYVDIRANLTYFAELYTRIRRERKPVEAYLNVVAPEERPAFTEFYARFYDYVDRSIARVNAVMAVLDGPTNTRASAK
jgi:hypothetical protein